METFGIGVVVTLLLPNQTTGVRFVHSGLAVPSILTKVTVNNPVFIDRSDRVRRVYAGRKLHVTGNRARQHTPKK